MIDFAISHLKSLLAAGSVTGALLAQVIPDTSMVEKLGVAAVTVVIMGAWVWQVIKDRDAAQKRADESQVRLDRAHDDTKATMERLFGRLEENTRATSEQTMVSREQTASLKDLTAELRNYKR